MLFDPDLPHADRDVSQGPPETPVWIWQRTWEFERLLALYRARKPQRVLEIGTFSGGTLYHFLQHAAVHAVIVSMDHYLGGGDDNRALYPSWTPADVTLLAWDVNSMDYATVEKARSVGPFDFIFIDGDHIESSVRRDWLNYHPLVRRGGVLAMHDILPAPTNDGIQVEPVWRDIQRAGFVTQEIVADPNAEWGGIGVVYL